MAKEMLSYSVADVHGRVMVIQPRNSKDLSLASRTGTRAHACGITAFAAFRERCG
jgi:hypothetical protein